MICANRDISSSLRSTTVTTEAKLELWSSWLLIVVDFLEDLFRNLVSHKLLTVRCVSLSFFLHSLRCHFDEKINIFFFMFRRKTRSWVSLPAATYFNSLYNEQPNGQLSNHRYRKYDITRYNHPQPDSCQSSVRDTTGICNLGYLQRYGHFLLYYELFDK